MKHPKVKIKLDRHLAYKVVNVLLIEVRRKLEVLERSKQHNAFMSTEQKDLLRSEDAINRHNQDIECAIKILEDALNKSNPTQPVHYKMHYAVEEEVKNYFTPTGFGLDRENAEKALRNNEETIKSIIEDDNFWYGASQAEKRIRCEENPRYDCDGCRNCKPEEEE